MFRAFFNFNDFMSHDAQGKSPIEKLLEAEDTTLEQLMEESDFISELRFNARLQKFMDRKQVSKLLDYVIQMPPSDATHTRGHKLPFVANEVFATENAKILDQFFNLPKPKEEEEEEKKEEEEPYATDDNKFRSFKAGKTDEGDEDQIRVELEEEEEEEEEDGNLAIDVQPLTFGGLKTREEPEEGRKSVGGLNGRADRYS
jgi:hypothetical protein